MCWICDHPGATQQDYFEELRSRVQKHGWAVQYVEIDRAPYAYTVGLHDRGLPELLVTGLSPSWAGRLLNCIARDAVEGHVLTPGEHLTQGAGPIIEIVEVEHPDAHMDWAIAFGGPDVRALQLVWADDCGRWPWALGFDGGRTRQPVLGVRAAPH
jgi:Domain of unknown function (DUF4262)